MSRCFRILRRFSFLSIMGLFIWFCISGRVKPFSYASNTASPLFPAALFTAGCLIFLGVAFVKYILLFRQDLAILRRATGICELQPMSGFKAFWYLMRVHLRDFVFGLFR